MDGMTINHIVSIDHGSYGFNLVLRWKTANIFTNFEHMFAIGCHMLIYEHLPLFAYINIMYY